MGDRVVSGLWDQSEALFPVPTRVLLAVRQGLLHFQSFLSGTAVAVFCVNVTAVPYLFKVGGGTQSPALNTVAQGILHWAESLRIRLAPQFIPGIRNVLADSLSHPHQLPSSEWSLNMDVVRSLRRQWPVMIDLCATSDNHRCSIYFSPSKTLSRRGRTCSSSPGTVSWRTLFRRGPFFHRCGRSLGCLTGPSLPPSPSTGLSVLGSWTSSSCRWLLQ